MKIMTNHKTWDDTVLPEYDLLRASVISVQDVALVDAVQHPNSSSRVFLFETRANEATLASAPLCKTNSCRFG
jgi:hypothetical protein